VWRTEVWPLQWRLAVQGGFNYLALWMYTPVMFQSHSPEVAGRMGMTLAVLTSLQMVALAWVQARVPLFGKLIAIRDFRELDRVFRRLTLIALGVFGVGALLILIAIVGLNVIQHSEIAS
jgi:Na+-driven multidrug efflux pump